MTRVAWIALALTLTGCGGAATTVDRRARPTSTPAAASPDAGVAAELDRLEAAVREAPADHPLADRYRELAHAHGVGPRAQQWLAQLATDPVAGREANVHFQLGMAYIDALAFAPPTSRSRLTGQALSSFDAALARNPNLWDARYAKGLVYLRMPASFKQYPKAIAAFTSLRDWQARLPPRPEFVLTYIRLSDAYVQGGDRRRAAAALRDGLRVFPEQPDLRHSLASLAAEPRP